jgi:hypothetical protein
MEVSDSTTDHSLLVYITNNTPSIQYNGAILRGKRETMEILLDIIIISQMMTITATLLLLLLVAVGMKDALN